MSIKIFDIPINIHLELNCGPSFPRGYYVILPSLVAMCNYNMTINRVLLCYSNVVCDLN